MIWLYYTLLLLVSVLGIALVTVTLPGLWLMTGAAALYAIATHERALGVRSLVALFILSLAGEILEFTAGGAAARAAGGGRRAAIGAVLGAIAGGIVGSIVLPLVLTIVGVCLGSLVGAAAFELAGGGEALHSLRVGWGAAKGRFFGVVIKLAIGLLMLLIVFLAGFP